MFNRHCIAFMYGLSFHPLVHIETTLCLFWFHSTFSEGEHTSLQSVIAFLFAIVSVFALRINLAIKMDMLCTNEELDKICPL